MSKQVQVYSVDTSFFYNENEMKIHDKLNRTYIFRSTLKKLKNKKSNKDNNDLIKKIERHITNANKRIKKLRDKLCLEFTKNNSVRTLNTNRLRNKNVISVFDSVLSRTLGMPENSLSEDIIVVQTYFFDILEDVIVNGFIHNGEKYIVFTASAGQIRTKKTVFIKEKVWYEYQYSLTCGLSVEHINSQGGVNINKYLAYLALCNSATDPWTDFDINKVIVVDDMETVVRTVVDFIDEKTYEITRKEMGVAITHTDGCGMILPKKSKKSMMIRMPWIKGLLVPFPFDKFIRENTKMSKMQYGTVKDVYGKEYDILKDGIEVILTKSQFKMWRYYSSWDEYKDKYKKYNCQSGKCNEEEDVIGNAKLNYQMLQTLNNMSDEELKKISEHTINRITKIGKDKKTMLNVLGVTPFNKNKNHFQQALEIYPELLNDTYSKEILKQVKRSMVKEAKSGKLEVDGKYTFICPDLYAFSEWLILGDKNPKGLLQNGDVYCSLYKDKNKIDCLRSPHLYREHAIRNNVVDQNKGRWFVTKGLYTSVHDPISKILMFDNDGDKALCVADDTIVDVADQHMKDIVPLFYNMAVAGKESVNNQSIYDGLKAAYSGGNIGMISNDITKIWNSEDTNLEVIKWLCMENNFVIDYAKTLYKLTRPSDKGKTIKGYTKAKTPHFFIYAKDKKKENVEDSNKSVVNRLEKMIRNTPLSFKATDLGKFNHKILLSNMRSSIKLDEKIIDKYTELDLKSHFMINNEDSKQNNLSFIYQNIREEVLKVNNDLSYVVDVLVDYLYNYKKSSFKTTLWECFGDVIVSNIKRNVESKIGEKIQCDVCGKRIEITNNKKKYCDGCAKKINIQKTIENRKKCLKQKNSVSLDT